MSAVEEVKSCYRQMYDGMIRKDRALLDKLLDRGFVLVHMTGMRQDKAAFIRAVEDGTLNYYAAGHEDIRAEVYGDWASLVGRSRVNAAVFGGGKHTWRLQLELRLVRKDGAWKIARAEASTY